MASLLNNHVTKGAGATPSAASSTIKISLAAAGAMSGGSASTMTLATSPSQHDSHATMLSSWSTSVVSGNYMSLSNPSSARLMVTETRSKQRQSQQEENSELMQFSKATSVLSARSRVLSTPFDPACVSSISGLVADAACYASILCATRPREISQLLQRKWSGKSQQQLRSFSSSSKVTMSPLLSNVTIRQQILAQHQHSPLYRHRMKLLRRQACASAVGVSTDVQYDARGLRNPSQMCFVNSVLQALTSLPSVVSYLQSSVWVQAAAEVQSTQSQSPTAQKELSDVLLELLLDLGGVGYFSNSMDEETKSLSSTPSSSRIHIASTPLDKPANHTILHTISKRHSQFSHAHTPGSRSVGHEQHDAQEFFQALMEHLVSDAHKSHFMDVSVQGRLPDVSVILEHENRHDSLVSLPTLLKGMQLEEDACVYPIPEEDDSFHTADSEKLETGRPSAVNIDPSLIPHAYTTEDLMCDLSSDGGEEKKSNEDYAYKHQHRSSKSSSDEKPMTHVTTSATETTVSTSTIESFETQSLSSLSETDFPVFNEQLKLLSTLHPTAPSPISGWLGSCLQCCTCHHVRPIHNSPFVDLPIVPTAITNLLERRQRFYSGDKTSVDPKRSSATASPLSPTPGCSLQECLADFSSIERVHDVECLNCALIQAKDNLNEEIELLQHGIASMERKGKDTSPLKAELDAYLKRQQGLTQMDPDDEFLSSSSTNDVNCELEEATTAGSGTLKPLKRDFWKCLLVTRLPTVLCIHVQRRYYNASRDCMAKALQHVAFPETLDMAPYCVYAGERFMRTAKQQPSIPYRLMSVVEHRGNAHMGHYVAYRRLVKDARVVSDRWVRISDEMVSVVDWNDVRRCQAYMLFYEAC